MGIRRYTDLLQTLPRPAKVGLVILVDMASSLLATWLAYTLRLESWHVPNTNQGLTYLLAAASFLIVFGVMRIYAVIFRYVSVKTFKHLARAVGVYAALFFGTLLILEMNSVPRSVGLIQPAVFILFLFISRGSIGVILNEPNSDLNNKRMLIYGAGAAGSQLMSGLSIERNDHVFGFIDDDPRKHGRRMFGIPIFAAGEISEVMAKYQITDILLALPSIHQARRQEIIRQLSEHKVRVSTIPGLVQLVGNGNNQFTPQSLAPDDFLPRPPAERPGPISSVAGKTVLVTGGGGSIGSEICRQLVGERISTLIIVEHSEYNLYRIDQEVRRLSAHANMDLELIPVLADIRDEERIDAIFAEYRPDTVYHAAAYKHVPLVEANQAQAVLNNYFGSRNLARIAARRHVERFVMISTDKAVRPTNVMGASKRLAEIAVQLEAAESQKTIFTMVRFGNVIGSSGSAIPLFQSQISNGGPVTITHPEVTRYFMSIGEAVTLVLQAGEMAKGGEVFVLDMGEPIKVVDLVSRMIKLYGKEERTADNPDGEIAIEYIGLRPGEKMYEELVLGAELEQTAHRRIFSANEPFPDRAAFAEIEARLRDMTAVENRTGLRDYLMEIGILR